MAFNAVIDKTELESAMIATADSIRDKTGGSDTIPWDNKFGFADAISKIESGGGELASAEGVAFGTVFPKEITHTSACYEVSSGTTLTGNIVAEKGDWILATVTTRSTTTFPTGWKVLRESTALSSSNGNQRMAFLCKQATVDGEISITVTQASSARIYINLVVCRNINGFAYHEGTEVCSNTEAVSVTVTRPTYDCVIWGCTAYGWNTSPPYEVWSSEGMTEICLDQTNTQPRQANFIDEAATAAERIFTTDVSGANGYIIDCVEVILLVPESPDYDSEYSMTIDRLNGIATQVQRLANVTGQMTPDAMESSLSNMYSYYKCSGGTTFDTSALDFESSAVGELS